MQGCPFCRIIEGQAAADELYRDERAVAFCDINPQAPVHILVVPTEHIASLAEASAEHQELLGHLLLVGARVAAEQGITERGYRAVINTNRGAGQTVYHVHLHIIGGRPMGWPPG
jgi:histidine triad (HIT) family protein